MNYLDLIIIEDNKHDIAMIMDALHESGIDKTMSVFRDGAEALKYFSDPAIVDAAGNIGLPKLVLLDLKLPKVNGLEVLKFLKTGEKTKYIPVVIFTSSNEITDRLESYRLGANSYVVKPLDADMFADFVKQITQYWTTMNTDIH